ncbi:MipA/OmpV family protein [Actibacterium sp. 188UL27-1]|uniref:MipA/OmpV family protein n=1 Tax=Actibacterium sp. 188UL27-1 TaxID=2786961 RepID=UPI00195AF5F9|nr:MipA/OmpV family protein [Actibacterium sp. 188UL27-1]MBM7067263.1 MipA/OmpV family protein [Actibacterium sp. 188UL27-1]
MNLKLICISAVFGLTSQAALAETQLEFVLGAGASNAPAYIGSDENEWSPTGILLPEYVKIGRLSFGSIPGQPEKLGFGLRGSFRVVGERDSSEYDELDGLDDVDAAVELGFGVGYEAERYRVFVDVRQGIGGHSGQVAEFGGDLKWSVNDALSVEVGPRVFLGSDAYFDAYFNVTDDEAAASQFDAYNSGGGLVSSGLQLRATYELNPDWSVIGTYRHDVLRDDAADSPIVEEGSDRQNSVSVLLTRRFSLNF